MYINRDISKLLSLSSAWIQVLLGPRQCGKSTLFASLFSMNNETGGVSTPVLSQGISVGYGNKFKEITFDDLQMRQLANQDPALFLQQFELPLLLDEVQYVPNLFPE